MSNESQQTHNRKNSREIRTKRIHALLNKFEKDFPTEQDCLKELFRLARVADKFCRFCRHTELEKQSGERAGRCRSCNKITWFTAGTWLHHMKKPKARLAAIYFADRGEYLSSSAFAGLLKITQSSAFEILKWLSLVIETLMPDKELQVHSSKFVPLFCKRSKETPAGAHPASEQQRAEEAEEERRSIHDQKPSGSNAPDDFLNIHSETSKPMRINNLHAPATASAIIELLSISSFSFDEICNKLEYSTAELSSTLTLLELDGLVLRNAGDRYSIIRGSANRQSSSKEESTVIDFFIKFIREIFQGISRKYLQRYIALYWCRSVHKLRSEGEFMQCCLTGTPIRKKTDCKTPLLVTLSSNWQRSY